MTGARWSHASSVSIRIISRSDEETMLVFDKRGGVREVPNPQRNQPVLTDARARTLAAAAQKLEGIFVHLGPLDIEWLFVGDRLHIVQVRPYVRRE